MPDLPTIAESGLPGYETYTWNALFAPAGTPPEVIATPERGRGQALADPEVQAKLAGLRRRGRRLDAGGAGRACRRPSSPSGRRWSRLGRADRLIGTATVIVA